MKNTRKNNVLSLLGRKNLNIKQNKINKLKREKKIRNNGVKNIIKSHILNNRKAYIVLGIFFTVGILLGVLYINNVQEEQFNNIDNYLNSFINNLKNIESFNIVQLIKNGIIDTAIFALIIWFMGTTVIRNTYSIWNDSI